MAIDKDKVQIANLALQYLSNIQSITNGDTRKEALKLILGNSDLKLSDSSFTELFNVVFSKLLSSCTNESRTKTTQTND